MLAKRTQLGPSSITGQPGEGARSPWLWFVAGCLTAALLGGVGYWILRPPMIPDPSRYRFTPFSFEPGGSGSPHWSPDGKSVAYSASISIGSPAQVFVRALDAPAPLQLTHSGYNSDGSSDNANVLGWMPDGHRVVYSRSQRDDLWAVSTAGGEPEQIPFPAIDADRVINGELAPNVSAIAILMRPEAPERLSSLWYSAPVGSPPKKYTPDPFGASAIYGTPIFHFTPDSHHLMLVINHGQGEEAWFMPFPPNPKDPPRRILKNLKTVAGSPDFSFFPDGRHIAIRLQSDRAGTSQIWECDIDSDKTRALTGGTSSYVTAAVSPDGSRMILEQYTNDLDVVSIDLQTGKIQKLIATDRNESMPAWAAKAPVLVYVTDRNGEGEIWQHQAGQSDRPLITNANFGDNATEWFMGPVPSPDGQRIIFTRIANSGTGMNDARLWISSLSGGSPVRMLGPSELGGELPGSWSPDGKSFAFLGINKNGAAGIYVAETSGLATPEVLESSVAPAIPLWSPTGEWIQYCDRERTIQLISPDGKQHRGLGRCDSSAYGFSADGKQLFGMRESPQQLSFYARDVATGREKLVDDVGVENHPASDVNPSTRLSLAPDGRSFAYSLHHYSSNLWLFDGFNSSKAHKP